MLVVLLCVIVAFDNNGSVCGQSWTLMERYQSWMTTAADLFENINEITVPDRILCEWKCFNTVDCVVVSFNSTENTCVLGTTKKKQLKYVQAGDMNVGISIIRPIIVSEVRYSTSEYSYSTVEEARNACNLIGLKLMTYDELNSARVSEEYTNCRCGFVEEGDTYIPAAAIECFNTTIGMNSCSVTLANAYCCSP